MSIKRMVTKLALAFAAKKGLDLVQGMGGIRGVQASLKNASQRSGDDTKSTGSRSDNNDTGLNTLLGKLGMTGAASGGSLGAVFGSLATAFGSPAPQASDDLDTEFATTDPVSDDDAAPVLRAMVQMARADGSINEDEQAALFEILDDGTASEKATLTAALREPVDARGLANDTPSHARKEVYSAALLIGKPDTEHERDFLQTLATALDLKQHELDRLHSAMGKPRLVLP